MSGRVFHILDEREAFSEHSGGAISRWAANVLREGEEIVVCPDYDATWEFAPERIFKLPGWADVARIHPLLYRVPWGIQRTWYLRILAGFLREIKPNDTVYVHNRPACAAALATAARTAGFQVYLHMHNSMLLDCNRGQLKALQDTQIVYCSRFLKEEAERLLPVKLKNAHVVYNGADDRLFQPQASAEDAEQVTVIFTGRLVFDKGVHVLLDAMRLLEKTDPSVRCLIVGGSRFGGSKPTRYVRRLHQKAPANCTLLGYRSGAALAGLLREADIFCCPSVWNDPFPLAPLEAMAAGLPVVASRVGGLPEALAHGGGLLIEQDDAQKLAEAIASLARDRHRRLQMGIAARRAYEEHFRWSSVRAQYLNVLRGARA